MEPGDTLRLWFRLVWSVEVAAYVFPNFARFPVEALLTTLN